jgi:hypothetical protein
VPPSLQQPIGLAFLALDQEGRDVLYSRPGPHHVKGDVAKATKAVRTAYDDLQAFRASHGLELPSSLPNIAKSLDKLCAELNVIADSTEALSIVHGCALGQESDSAETPLPNAIVHDMEATATCFRTMRYASPIEMSAALGEQQCQKIQEMVDRYETIASTILNKHKECVLIEQNPRVWLLSLIDP